MLPQLRKNIGVIPRFGKTHFSKKRACATTSISLFNNPQRALTILWLIRASTICPNLCICIAVVTPNGRASFLPSPTAMGIEQSFELEGAKCDWRQTETSKPMCSQPFPHCGEQTLERFSTIDGNINKTWSIIWISAARVDCQRVGCRCHFFFAFRIWGSTSTIQWKCLCMYLPIKR